jgi:hypothetical protein
MHISAKRTNTKPTVCLQTLPSSQKQTPPDATIVTTIASFACLATRVANVRVLFTSHERRSRTAKRDGHWLLY